MILEQLARVISVALAFFLLAMIVVILIARCRRGGA
jgi:hypothetical protein